MIHLGCGKCGHTIARESWNAQTASACPRCLALQYTRVYSSATGTEDAPTPPHRIQTEGEGSCYFHAANRAEAGCPSCGRFLCSLCQIQRPGGMLCPSCFSYLRKERSPEVARRYIMHDSLALLLTTLPMALIIWPLFTTPAAIIYNLINFNRTRSVLPRSPWRKWAVFAVAGVQILLAAVIGYLIVQGRLN